MSNSTGSRTSAARICAHLFDHLPERSPLVRNQPIAIVGILMLGFVVEPLLSALAPEVGRFGPTGSLPLAIQDIDPEDVGFGDVEPLSPALAVLAMLAWIGAAFAAGAALLQSRDVE